MKREERLPEGRRSATKSGRRRSRPTASLTVESLEQRQLLSLYQGPTRSRVVFSGHAFYQVSVTGGGYEQLTQLGSGHHAVIGINLFGTTAQSQLNITLKSAFAKFGTQNTELQVGTINVQSGLLGAINAGSTTALVGNVTKLSGTVQTIAFASLGPNAQIDVQGSVASFQVGSTDLSPNGLVHVAGNVTGQLSLGAVNLDGGKVLVDGDAVGGLNLGSLSIEHGGQFLVGGDVTGSSSLGAVNIDGGRLLLSHNVTAPVSTADLIVKNTGQFIVGNDLNALQVSGSEKILSNGLLQVGDDLGTLTVGRDLTIDSGKMVVGTDVTGAVNVSAGVNLSNNGVLSIGRDILGAATITGDLKLDSGGTLNIGRNTNTITINGNVLFTPSAGTVNIGGNVAGLTINGIYQGRRNTSASSPEFNVGLNLNNLTVMGGTASQGGIQNANINVAKDIVGLSVPHGIFNSLVTAGVLIDGSAQSGSSGGNLGADGSDAVFDSQILAGVQIKNILINGNVHSDWVTNPTPTGLPTRIVAGEDRSGAFISGGNIDNFQITGALIDAVLAASVQPYGGDGTLPPTGYGATRTPASPPPPGVPTNYNAPLGTITGGTFQKPVPYPNYGYVSWFNETMPTTAYNTAIDPDVHVNILPGAINASFASPPAASSVTSTIASNASSSTGVSSGQTSISSSSATGQSQTVTTTVTTTNIALPTKSTVLGGVISNVHTGNPDANDYAGVYAADTRGVFIGVIPTPPPPGS